MPHVQTEVAVYRGEDIIASGTYEECGAVLGVQAKTIQFYTTPTYQRRLARRKRDGGRRIAVIKLDSDEEDE